MKITVTEKYIHKTCKMHSFILPLPAIVTRSAECQSRCIMYCRIMLQNTEKLWNTNM